MNEPQHVSSYSYIKENFLTRGALAHVAGCCVEDIQRLQEAGALPGPAYCVEVSAKISSYIGAHTETLFEDYYPVAYGVLVKELLASDAAQQDLAECERTAFEDIYREMLLHYNAREKGMAAYFKEDGTLDDAKTGPMLQEEWGHYLEGTYGLCTRSATPREIALKSVTIAEIKQKMARAETTGLTAEERDSLREAVKLFDDVAAPFSPYERPHCSRAKYYAPAQALLED